MYKASRPPARAMTSQTAGGMPSLIFDSGEMTAMTSTGSGLNDGPPLVSRSSSASSRPQTIHAQGS
jgi:hypothetical protein